MNTKFVKFALVALILAFGSQAWAAGNPNADTLNVSAGITANGVKPATEGAPPEFFYAYCVASDGSLTDSIPVTFTVTDTDGSAGDSYTVSFNAAGGLASTVTLPGSFSITDDGTPITQTIYISTGPLTHSGDVNIHISATPSGKIVIPNSTIHIHVLVGGDCSATSCFFTDSDFNYLTDCSGADVTTASGGTFAIVANAKGVVVSTNPGQFYYNLIWPNGTGADQSVTINLTATNLDPQGANAVHAMVFDSLGVEADVFSFDMVNTDGTPCGPSGPCTVTVSAGQTLWVTWHLDYQWLGAKVSGLSLPTSCSGSCTGYALITATGTLTDSSGDQLGTCTATACGYLKK